MFSLRIISTDNAMLEPVPGLDMTYSEFKSSKIYKVPVIRICGTTTAGRIIVTSNNNAIEQLICL